MFVGVLYGLGAAVLWTVANVLIQPASQRFGAVGALVWAQLLGGLMVLPFAFYYEGLPGDAGSGDVQWWTVVLGGFAAMAAYTGLFEALRLGQLALVVPVTSLWVVVSTAIGVGLLENELGLWGALGLLCVVVGNIVVARFGATGDDSGNGEPVATLNGQRPTHTPMKALLWAGASGIGFGVMVPVVDILGKDIGRLWALPTVWGAELLLGLPLWLWMGSLKRRPRSLNDWLIATRVGLFEILGFVSLSVGLAYADVTRVTPASSIGTALAVLWGVLLLGERPPRLAVAGAAIAAAGVFVAAL